MWGFSRELRRPISSALERPISSAGVAEQYLYHMLAVACSAQCGERDVQKPTWEVSRGLRLPMSSALESLNMLARSFGRMGLLLALGSRLPAYMHITITLIWHIC